MRYPTTHGLKMSPKLVMFFSGSESSTGSEKVCEEEDEVRQQQRAEELTGEMLGKTKKGIQQYLEKRLIIICAFTNFR